MKNSLITPLTLAATIVVGPALASNTEVDIQNHAFSQKTVSVAVGSQVTWVNLDQDPHSVADSSDNKQFHSAALDTKDKFSFTFTKPGKYAYFCTLHPDMVGTVIVK